LAGDRLVCKAVKSPSSFGSCWSALTIGLKIGLNRAMVTNTITCRQHIFAQYNFAQYIFVRSMLGRTSIIIAYRVII